MEVIADYNKDFYAWLMKNADLLRQHKFNEVDIEHVAEEFIQCEAQQSLSDGRG